METYSYLRIKRVSFVHSTSSKRLGNEEHIELITDAIRYHFETYKSQCGCCDGRGSFSGKIYSAGDHSQLKRLGNGAFRTAFSTVEDRSTVYKFVSSVSDFNMQYHEYGVFEKFRGEQWVPPAALWRVHFDVSDEVISKIYPEDTHCIVAKHNDLVMPVVVMPYLEDDGTRMSFAGRQVFNSFESYGIDDTNGYNYVVVKGLPVIRDAGNTCGSQINKFFLNT